MLNDLRENGIDLQRFAEYLLTKQLVPDAHAKYYVLWVRRFFQQVSNDPRLTRSERLDHFLIELRKDQRYAEWQLTQAERAVRLYFFNFLNDAEWTMSSSKRISPETDGSIPTRDALAETRRILRLRHYSYRTEQTYMDWIGRFFEYLRYTHVVRDLRRPAQSPMDLLDGVKAG
jgi:hypothetical protein